jgi:hypothetical protein
VVWGLSFATGLTLFLTPVALAAPETLKRRLDKSVAFVRGRIPGRKPTPPPEEQRPQAAE